VTEDGFTYSGLGSLFVNSRNAFSVPGQDMEGATASCCNGEGGGFLNIGKAGGGNFVFDSLDFAAFGNFGGSQTVFVEGSVGNQRLVDQYTLGNTSISNPTYANWTREFASVLAGKTLGGLTIELFASFSFEPPFIIASTNGAIDNVALGPPLPPVPVPEASTWAMMALGFGALGLAGWRSRRRSVSLA
jgi:hypothetical protein